MAQILHQAKWTRQPQYLTGIDWSNPLSRSLRNLIVPVVFRPADLVTGVLVTKISTTNLNIQGGSGGTGYRCIQATQVYDNADVVQLSGTVTETLIFGIVPLAPASIPPSVDQRVFDNGSSDNNPPTLQVQNAGAGRFSWQPKRSGTNGQFHCTRSYALGEVLFHCLQTDYSIDTSSGASVISPRWWINGIEQTLTCDNSSSGGTNQPPIVRLGGIGAAARGFEGLMLYWGKYDRLLTPAEAVAITLNPWQLLAPAPRLWALNTITAGGTLKTVNGLPIGSIKTIQGLAKANVKTYDGLTP